MNESCSQFYIRTLAVLLHHGMWFFCIGKSYIKIFLLMWRNMKWSRETKSRTSQRGYWKWVRNGLNLENVWCYYVISKVIHVSQGIVKPKVTKPFYFYLSQQKQYFIKTHTIFYEPDILACLFFLYMYYLVNSFNILLH